MVRTQTTTTVPQFLYAYRETVLAISAAAAVRVFFSHDRTIGQIEWARLLPSPLFICFFNWNCSKV